MPSFISSITSALNPARLLSSFYPAQDNNQAFNITQGSINSYHRYYDEVYHRELYDDITQGSPPPYQQHHYEPYEDIPQVSTMPRHRQSAAPKTEISIYHREAIVALREGRAPTHLLQGAYYNNVQLMENSITAMLKVWGPTSCDINILGPHPSPNDAPFKAHGKGSALHFAALRGNDDAVAFLLANGASSVKSCHNLCKCVNDALPLPHNVKNATTKNTKECSALHLALCHGQSSTAEMLLTRSTPSLGNCWKVGGEYILPLHTAAYAGHRRQILELIINELPSRFRDKTLTPRHRDAEALNCFSPYGAPLHYAVAGSATHGTAAIDRLVGMGADINIERPGISTPLSVAVSNGLWPAAERLIKLGASIKSSFDNRPALFDAIFTKGTHLRLTTQGSRYRTTETKAWALGREKVIKLILEKSNFADLYSIDPQTGHTPVTYAAFAARQSDCHQALLPLFLRRGAGVNQPNKNGNTALHILASAMDEPYLSEELYQAIRESIKGILRKGGRLSLEFRNKDGKTPIEILVEARERVTLSRTVRGRDKLVCSSRCGSLMALLVRDLPGRRSTW